MSPVCGIFFNRVCNYHHLPQVSPWLLDYLIILIIPIIFITSLSSWCPPPRWVPGCWTTCSTPPSTTSGWGRPHRTQTNHLRYNKVWNNWCLQLSRCFNCKMTKCRQFEALWIFNGFCVSSFWFLSNPTKIYPFDGKVTASLWPPMPKVNSTTMSKSKNLS